MQRLKSLIIIPVILAAIVYGGIKAYIYFGIKAKLDAAVAQAQPFAQISYGGISSSLDGSIVVDTIEVKTPEQPIPVRIGTTKLRGPGIGFLFDVAAGFDRGDFPPMMQLYMRRLALPDVQQLVPSMLPSKRGLLDEPSDPCDLGRLLRDAGMMSSDTYPLYLDVNIGYEMDVQTGSSRLDFGYDVHGAESLMLEVELSGMPQPGAVMMGMVPAVDRIAIRYHPNGEYLQARVRECADQRGTPVPAYVQGLLAQPDRHLAKELGFVPGKGLRGAIGRFLQQPQEVVMIAGPIENPQLLGSGQMPPQQMVEKLNLLVSVNGEPVNDLSFTADADVPAAKGGMAGMATGDQPKKVKRQARYVETPISELGRYLGRPVRLRIAGHTKIQEGVLVGVGDEQVDVEKRVHKGKLSIHVELKNLQRIEVLRFPEH